MTISPETLNDLMLARVNAARRAVDRSASSTTPEIRRGQAPRADPGLPDTAEARETESLKRVFRDLGVTYRRYRSQIGGPVAPGLRDAAYAFRADPSFRTLLTVAGFLDRLRLLE
jgi:hypothetical protein